MYSYIKDNGCGGRTAKGVKKAVAQRSSSMNTIKTSYSAASS